MDPRASQVPLQSLPMPLQSTAAIGGAYCCLGTRYCPSPKEIGRQKQSCVEKEKEKEKASVEDEDGVFSLSRPFFSPNPFEPFCRHPASHITSIPSHGRRQCR